MEWESSFVSLPVGGGSTGVSTGGHTQPQPHPGDNVNIANYAEPYLEIVAQPQPKFRFRYKSEMTGKHGSLLGVGVSNVSSAGTGTGTCGSGGFGGQQFTEFGEPASTSTGNFFTATSTTTSSTAFSSINPNANININTAWSSSSGTTAATSLQSKLFPTVKLHNFAGEAIVRVSLVCENKPHYPHPHILEMGQSGPGELDNFATTNSYSCYVEVPVSSANDHTAVFQGLNIIFVSKKESRRVLQNKMSQVDNPERKVSLDKLDDLSLTANLNVVALYFEAFVRHPNDPGLVQFISSPVVSSSIHHNKSTQTGELRIVRIDKFSSCCTGNEEVFILVEKVDKHNIQVKFYQESDKGLEIWKAYGKFAKLDVHHQYAIVFKTPPYRSFDIDTEVDVWIQLERPTDGATSQPIRFQYRPVERIRKMPKRQPRSGNDDPNARQFEPRPESPNSDHSGSGQGGNPSGNESDHNEGGKSLAGPSSGIRQGAGNSQTSFPCGASTMASQDEATQSKALAMSVALSICQGLHGWAETSDFSLVLQKLRHLLCLVNENGDNALHSAIIHQQKEPFLNILETLASYPDTVGVINEPNIQNLTPMHLAVLSNRMDFVSELVRHNADVSLQNSEGDTPFHIAVKSNNVPCVKYLLQASTAPAAINKFNYLSMSPLQIAITNGFTELVDILCSNKASLTAQEGTFGRTPLHIAVEKETKESIICTLMILKSGGMDADLTNIANYRGDTALHSAANSGFTTLTALLMHYGADPMIENHVRKETEDEDEDSNPTNDNNDERLSGQTVFDLAANEQVLRVLKGTVDDWEIILKACSPLIPTSLSPTTTDKDKDPSDSKYLDSGIDVNNFNSSQFLSSSSSNQL